MLFLSVQYRPNSLFHDKRVLTVCLAVPYRKTDSIWGHRFWRFSEAAEKIAIPSALAARAASTALTSFSGG
jgi:hypothetical protein